MGTSYVEFRKRGFWTRDSFLSDWLTPLIEEMSGNLPANDWSPPLIRHWEAQREIDGGCMDLALDSFLEEDEKGRQVISAAESALMRTDEACGRTGQLFLALLRGEVKTDTSSPIDYL
jgi:hypothetical protein